MATLYIAPRARGKIDSYADPPPYCEESKGSMISAEVQITSMVCVNDGLRFEIVGVRIHVRMHTTVRA